MSDQFPAFQDALGRLAVPQEVRALIVERHGEAHRHYHTLRHIDLMLRQIPREHAFEREMCAATLFHDIVYEPAESDNEEQSLALFQSVAGTFAQDIPLDVPLVGAMILATKSHHFRDEASEADCAINILLKADLSTLWDPDPRLYEWYAEGVRKEFSFVPEATFREARSRILTGLRDDLLRSGILARQETQALLRNIDWELQ